PNVETRTTLRIGNRSHSIRNEKYLQAIGPDGGSGITTIPAQLSHQDGGPKRHIIGGEGPAGGKIPNARATGPLHAGKIQGGSPVCGLKVGRAILVGGAINVTPEVDRRLPAKIILDILAMCRPQIEAPTPPWAIAAKIHPVAIGGKGGRIVVS